MKNPAIILVTEQCDPGSITEAIERFRKHGRLVVVRPTPSVRRLRLEDAVVHLEALRRCDERYDLAVLLCDSSTDDMATYARGRVSRALLPLIASGGRLLFETPTPSPRLCVELVGLIHALTKLDLPNVSLRLHVPSPGHAPHELGAISRRQSEPAPMPN